VDFESWKTELNKMVLDKGLLVTNADEPFTTLTGGDNAWKPFYDEGLSPFDAYCKESNLTPQDIEKIK